MAGYPGNFVDSGIKTVPNRLRTASNAPTTKLAYITPEEEGILQALKPGTPHKGPMGIPNYDSVDWDPSTGQYSVTTGAQASAQEVSPRDRTQQEKRDVAAAPEPSSLPSGQAYAFDPETYQPTGQVVGTPVVPPGPAEGTGIVQAVQDIIPDEAIDFAKDAWKTVQNAGGIFTSIPVAFFKKLAHPEMEDFKDPKFLAVIDKLFKEKNKELGVKDGEQFKKNYLDDYKKLMDEAFAGNEAMLAQGLSSEEFFNQQLEEASDLSEMGELGKGSQRINFPKEYYLDDGERGIMPQTTGVLENLAGLDASQYAGTDLAQMIFDARAELDRQQGAGGGGGGAGITGLPGIPPDLVQQPATILPPDLSDVVLGYGPGDMAYTGVMPRSGYQYTHDAAGNRYEIPIGGDQSGTTYRGNPFTFREGEPWQAPVGDKLTTAAPATTPTPFDYSQWPQFTSAYPGHYANWGAPSYVNGGIVSQARPQLDYWNRINRTYPGMR